MPGAQGVRPWLAASLVLVAASVGAYEADKLITETSKDWGRIVVDGRCAVINNVWNKGAATGEAKQTVFLKRVRGRKVFGWRWRWSSRKTVVAYPEVVCGDKPWDPPTRLAREFPFRAGTRRLTADFDITLRAAGAHNMAFSLWAVSGLPASPKRVTHEVMIWNANHGLTPAGSRQGRLGVAGVTYDVYVRENHGDASGANANQWTHVAFVARTAVLRGPLDIGAFIDYLLAKGIMSRSHYITSLELGNEVMDGTGTVEIRDYRVSVR